MSTQSRKLIRASGIAMTAISCVVASGMALAQVNGPSTGSGGTGTMGIGSGTNSGSSGGLDSGNTGGGTGNTGAGIGNTGAGIGNTGAGSLPSGPINSTPTNRGSPLDNSNPVNPTGVSEAPNASQPLQGAITGSTNGQRGNLKGNGRLNRNKMNSGSRLNNRSNSGASMNNSIDGNLNSNDISGSGSASTRSRRQTTTP